MNNNGFIINTTAPNISSLSEITFKNTSSESDFKKITQYFGCISKLSSIQESLMNITDLNCTENISKILMAFTTYDQCFCPLPRKKPKQQVPKDFRPRAVEIFKEIEDLTKHGKLILLRHKLAAHAGELHMSKICKTKENVIVIGTGYAIPFPTIQLLRDHSQKASTELTKMFFKIFKELHLVVNQLEQQEVLGTFYQDIAYLFDSVASANAEAFDGKAKKIAKQLLDQNTDY
ncbi:hypothetical protein HDU92_008635 [Lobulomyces angularis]|nr:hypothetical protein HDU92_008635 [Lobulomyces angularis]